MVKKPIHFLVLYPTNSKWAPDDLAAFAEQLRQTGLTGKRHRPGLFSAGPAYLEMIVYLGCSPQIALGETETATTIRLNGPFDMPELITVANARPRCRSCRQTLDLKKTLGWADETVTCLHCNTSSYAVKLDWRRKAGFARFFIEISNVFESEAVPSDGLLEKLEHLTGQTWDYFYWREG